MTCTLLITHCNKVVKYYPLPFRDTLHKTFLPRTCLLLVHSRLANNKSIRLHERALRIVYDDDVSTYDRVLDKGKFVCMMTTFQQMIGYLIRANLYV